MKKVSLILLSIVGGVVLGKLICKKHKKMKCCKKEDVNVGDEKSQTEYASNAL